MIAWKDYKKEKPEKGKKYLVNYSIFWNGYYTDDNVGVFTYSGKNFIIPTEHSDEEVDILYWSEIPKPPKNL